MLNYFFGNSSIRKAVLKTVEKRIESAQKIYDVELRALKKTKSQQMWNAYSEAIKAVKAFGQQYKAKKAELHERHVNNILAKII